MLVRSSKQKTQKLIENFYRVAFVCLLFFFNSLNFSCLLSSITANPGCSVIQRFHFLLVWECFYIAVLRPWIYNFKVRTDLSKTSLKSVQNWTYISVNPWELNRALNNRILVAYQRAKSLFGLRTERRRLKSNLALHGQLLIGAQKNWLTAFSVKRSTNRENLAQITFRTLRTLISLVANQYFWGKFLSFASCKIIITEKARARR